MSERELHTVLADVDEVMKKLEVTVRRLQEAITRKEPDDRRH